jgi:glycosyltransferase involved in cell wall biosynthesis
MSDLGGGTGDHLLSMFNRWKDRGWAARIISERPLTSRLMPGVPVDVLERTDWFDRYPITQLRRVRRIGRLLEEHGHDVVHSYFYWSIIYGRVLKKLGKIRYLIENREDQGYSWNRRDYAILRAGRSIPDRVICVSEAVRQVVLERERIDPDRVVVIHNGIEPLSNDEVGDRQAVREELGLNESDLVVGMVANLNRRVKGVSHFIDALPLILEAVPSVRFVIFGKGKEESALREQAQSLGVAASLKFAGFRPDIERYYAALDVSVLTSLTEGLSISLLQSMQHGLPVVVTRVGGNPEVVVEGDTGFLVPVRDPAEFARKVVGLLRDPDLRQRMGESGRARVSEAFQVERAADRYLEIYEEVLSARSQLESDQARE